MNSLMSLLNEGAPIILFFAANLIALFAIPIGLPGTLLQVLAAAGLTYLSRGRHIGWLWVGVFLFLALLGELVEFLSGQWGAKKFGGSRRAGWGAIIGGFVGALCGSVIPIFLIGSMIMSFVGTFVGAIVGEYSAEKSEHPDLRVGIGAVLGKALGVAVKTAIGFLIFLISIVLLIKEAI